jgi:hypothetical protein
MTTLRMDENLSQRGEGMHGRQLSEETEALQ